MQHLPLLVHGDPWLYRVARFVIVPLARLYGRLEVRGLEHVPQKGCGLVVANHPSDIDPLLVALAVRRTLHFLASDDHYERPFVGWCMRRLATVSVDRHGRASRALREAAQLLDAGELLAVFPEPNERRPPAISHSPSPAQAPLGAGIIRLAQAAGARLIDATIEGTQDLQWGSWRHTLPRGWLDRPSVRITFTTAHTPDAAGKGAGSGGGLEEVAVDQAARL